MSYFVSAEELCAELVAAFEQFLGTEKGRQAAALAASGFDHGSGLPDEPTVLVVTSEPASVTTLVLGDSARAEAGGQNTLAHVRLTADADALHDLLLENYDAGQIARAVEEKRLGVSGPPWSLDALIVLAGAFAGHYRSSLERRGRTDLLHTPAPAPAGVWEVPVPRPSDFVGTVVAGRRQFNQSTSRQPSTGSGTSERSAP
jgi:hypothetical protein